MAIAICPRQEEIERLISGELPEFAAADFERHIAECAACAITLERLPAGEETLADWLSQSTRKETDPASPAIRNLVAKLKSLHATADEGNQSHTSTPQPQSTSDATVDVPTGAQDDSSLTDFLSPSQQADELGRLGHYRILKVLGHGGMGVVYKAEDPKLKRMVAIKAMLPGLAVSASSRKRFRREAEAMAAVEHPHIVRVYQIDEDRGAPFLAMEFLKGQSLDERLKRAEPMSLAEILRIGREIAEGLEAAHATGLIHRDIKPGNIWLEAVGSRQWAVGSQKSEDKEAAALDRLPTAHSPLPTFRVKILDFGLARAGTEGAGLTLQGAIVGTPAYMAPEQGRGDQVDARSDLFSLGVILYRMATGDQPFKGADIVSTLMSVATTMPPSPNELRAELPTEFSELIMKLLEKDSARRPASAHEVVQSIQQLEAKLAGQKLAANEAVVSPRRRKRLPILAGLLGLAILLAAVVVLYFRTGDANTGVETNDEAKLTTPLIKRLTSPDTVWSAPENLGPGINTTGSEFLCSVTDDERLILYVSGRNQLMMSRRESREEPFPDGQLLPESINRDHSKATMTGDGLLLVFSSKREGSEGEDIWMSQRPSIDEPFGEPVRLPEPVNSSAVDRHPTLSADGLTMLLTSQRETVGRGEIYMLRRDSREQPFGEPVRLPAPINTLDYDIPCWISNDGRVLCTRTQNMQTTASHLWIKATPDAPYVEVAKPEPWPDDFVAEIRISADGERLYISCRSHPGGFGANDIWMVRRVPKMTAILEPPAK